MDDEIISETPVYIAQPANKQQLHVYSYLTRPNFRPYPPTTSISYYPIENTVQFTVQPEVSNIDQSSEHCAQEIQMSGQRIPTKNSTHGLLLKQSDHFILMPISEFYEFMPSVKYVEPDMTQFFKQENNEQYEIFKQTKQQIYQYSNQVPQQDELLTKLQMESKLDINLKQFQQLFFANHFYVNKPNIADQLKLQQLLKSQHLIKYSKLQQIFPDGDKLQQMLVEQCWLLKGNFVIKSKYFMAELPSMTRDLVIFMLNGLLKIDNQQLIIQKKWDFQTTINRQEVQNLTKQNPQILSKVFEVDDLVEFDFEQQKWVCGVEEDVEFVQQNEQFMANYLKIIQQQLEDLVKYWTQQKEWKGEMGFQGKVWLE